MSSLAIPVHMLLKARRDVIESKYTIIDTAGGCHITDTDIDKTYIFTESDLTVTLLDLTDDKYKNGKWLALKEVLFFMRISLPALAAQTYEMGSLNVIDGVSFATEMYMTKVWHEDEKVADYHVYVDGRSSIKSVCIPDRIVRVRSEQYRLYVQHLGNMLTQISKFEEIFSNADDWSDITNYGIIYRPNILSSISRTISNHWPECEYTLSVIDNVTKFELPNLTLVAKREHVNTLNAVVSTNMQDLKNIKCIKTALRDTLLFITYLNHITVP